MKTVRHISIDGVDHLEEEIAPEKLKEIYRELADRALRSIGCKPIQETDTA